MNVETTADIKRLKEIVERLGKQGMTDNEAPEAKCVIEIAYIDTPLGTLLAGATDRGLCMLEYPDYRSLETDLTSLSKAIGITFGEGRIFGTSSGKPGASGTSGAPLIEKNNAVFEALRTQLAEYFAGTRREFDLPLHLVGTDFQKQAWLALRHIPYGRTSTYLTQAQSIGRTSAVRAVANANGKNRISIILPCHRVIGSDGSLTGYGGGLWRKRKLLELEGAIAGTLEL